MYNGLHTMKRSLITFILALSCTHCAAIHKADSTALQTIDIPAPSCTDCISFNKTSTDVLQANDMIRTADDAERKAAKARITASANVETKGVAIGLIRAHTRANDIERGDWVWLVSITHTQKKLNHSDQTTASIPDDLVWVRAKDGWVADLVPFE
jgi:hypothetical protein